MKAKGLLLFVFFLAACDKPAPQAADVAQSAPTAAPATQPAQSAPANTAESAQQFWTRFRGAALANDAAALESLARFPFKTRGETDDDPVVTHEAATFAQLVPKILAQDPGLKAQPETMRDFLERNAELPQVAQGGGQFAPVAADATQFSAGTLTFEKDGDRWQWVSAYVGE